MTISIDRSNTSGNAGSFGSRRTRMSNATSPDRATPYVLLIEDEIDLAKQMQQSLQSAGYEVHVAKNSVNGLNVARNRRPDVIVLNLTMPDIGGIQVCWKLRRDPLLAAVPILFLSTKAGVEDRVLCLEEGGDDCLIKPFDMRELMARVKALLRRRHVMGNAFEMSAPGNEWLTVGPIALNMHTCEAFSNNETVQLTPSEFELLRYLMKHPKQVFSSQHLIRAVWGYAPESADPSLVRWHIKNLRSKIEPRDDGPVYIRTVARYGYILDL